MRPLRQTLRVLLRLGTLPSLLKLTFIAIYASTPLRHAIASRIFTGLGSHLSELCLHRLQRSAHSRKVSLGGQALRQQSLVKRGQLSILGDDRLLLRLGFGELRSQVVHFRRKGRDARLSLGLGSRKATFKLRAPLL